METKGLYSSLMPDVPLIVAALLDLQLFFSYWFHKSQKSYWDKNVGTTESHLECNVFTTTTKLLWKSLNLLHELTKWFLLAYIL